MIRKKHSHPKKSNVRQLSKLFLPDMFTQTSGTGRSASKGETDFFRCMIDQIGDDVMVVDSLGRIVFVNAAMVKAMGYAKKDILYRPVVDFIEEKFSIRRWQKKYFMEVKKKKRPVSYTISRVAKGGKVRTIDVTAAHMAYRSKDYMLTVGRDITHHLAFQAKLEASEDRYRILSEQAAEGILMLNTEGVILYANKAAADTFKVPVLEVIGTRFEKYMDKASLPRALKCFKKVREGVPSVCNDLDIKNKDGKMISSEFSASPIFTEKKVTQVHVIFRNMMQRKEMERLLRESEKMKALQRLVVGMTREIQQPLKGLLDGSSRLIEKYEGRDFEYIGYKEFKDIIKTLRTMNDQVKYCFDTTDRIVGLGRKRAQLTDRRCSANEAVQEAVDFLKHSLEVSDIKLKLKLSSNLPPAAIVLFDLSQALANILTNAIQSLPSGGGTIHVKTTFRKATGLIRIDCQDDGVGIPKEILGRVFEPFFTTKPRGLEKSSGLGLSIVYSIIKNYQGEVKIQSHFRKGTLVSVFLPAYRLKRLMKRK